MQEAAVHALRFWELSCRFTWQTFCWKQKMQRFVAVLWQQETPLVIYLNIKVKAHFKCFCLYSDNFRFWDELNFSPTLLKLKEDVNFREIINCICRFLFFNQVFQQPIGDSCCCFVELCSYCLKRGKESKTHKNERMCVCFLALVSRKV